MKDRSAAMRIGVQALALATTLASAALPLAASAQAPSPPQAQQQTPTPPPAPSTKARADLILAADIDGYLAATRTAQQSEKTVLGAIVIAADQIARAEYAPAGETIAALTRRTQRTTVEDLLEMWSLLLQGKKEEAYQRANVASPRLAAGLGAAAMPLLMEAGGDLDKASAEYDRVIADLDTSPLPAGAPADAAAARRVLAAPRMAQIIYRAAVLAHRQGKRDAALKYYLLTEQFAPGSPNIADNLARLERRAPPREPALTARSGFGRWVFFVGYQFALDYGLRRAQGGGGSPDPLDALVGSVFAELGLKFDPGAEEWRVSVANDLIGAGGVAGAAKLLTAMPDDSPFAPDVKIAQARMAIDKNDDAAAAAAAQQALNLSRARWDINLEAGRLLTVAGRDREAVAALSAAVDGADRPPMKAEALLARAGAHYQAGRLAEAGQDARAAVAADNKDGVQMSAAGFLSTAPDGWFEAIRLGREALFARPRSVDAMNTLGYALIQREQGLDEGFKLLAQGMQQQPDFYPIVDSLGWAYYNLGDFTKALELVAKANELSKDEPNAEVLDHLGDIHWRLRRQDEARKFWRQALTLRPDATRRVDVERKLRTGLTAPAPAKRPPPVVDYNPYRATPDNGPI